MSSEDPVPGPAVRDHPASRTLAHSCDLGAHTLGFPARGSSNTGVTLTLQTVPPGNPALDSCAPGTHTAPLAAPTRPSAGLAASQLPFGLLHFTPAAVPRSPLQKLPEEKPSKTKKKLIAVLSPFPRCSAFTVVRGRQHCPGSAASEQDQF